MKIDFFIETDICKLSVILPSRVLYYEDTRASGKKHATRSTLLPFTSCYLSTECAFVLADVNGRGSAKYMLSVQMVQVSGLDMGCTSCANIK